MRIAAFRALWAAVGAASLTVVAWTGVGCQDVPVITCTVANQMTVCQINGTHGKCEASTRSDLAFCALPDKSCPGSALRWATTAGDGLAKECLAPLPDLGMGMDMSVADQSEPDFSVPDLSEPDQSVPDLASPPDLSIEDGAEDAGVDGAVVDGGSDAATD